MLIQKISLNQKKIIIIAFIVTLIFLALWIFIYLPSQNQLVKIKLEFIGIEKKLRKIENTFVDSQSMEESIKLLKKRYAELNCKFPGKEEEGLKVITDSARKHNIEIVSIKSHPKTAFLDKDNQKIEIEGRICQCVPVAIQMKSSYQDLVEYIQDLTDSLSIFVIIERLKINKDISGTEKLNISLELNLHLLS